MAGRTVLMCDMPALTNRIKLAQQHSIDEWRQIFDTVLNRIVQGRGPVQPRAAAYFHYPHLLNSNRDHYLTAVLQELSMQTREATVHMGNLHLQPVSRLWNTHHKRNYLDYCRVPDLYTGSEKAEEKIAKHALLEALLQT